MRRALAFLATFPIAASVIAATSLTGAVPVFARTAPAADMIGEFRPMQPRFVNVGGRDVVLYYTDGPQGFEVVATFAANLPDDGVSMRTAVALAPGQWQVMSMGNAASLPPATLRIERIGDRLVVTPPQVMELQASNAKAFSR